MYLLLGRPLWSIVYTIQSKTLKIEELKSKQSALRISDQLSQSHIQQKIQMFRQEIEEQICSENPTAFWHQKKHEVMLPYKDDYKGKPCKSRAIPMNVEYQKLCSEEIKNLLSKGLIRESISPWNCYGFYVNKHSEQIRGIPRLVVNYKPLNKVLADDTYPIPNKTTLVTRIAGAMIFSKFDLKSGFWQVAIKEEDKFKKTFSIPAGHYEWNVMPFGLKNAPAKFQRVMDDTLKPYFDWFIVYIDDILVFSSSIDQHFKHIKKFIQVVKQTGLVFSKKKIELFKPEVKYLGHIIQNGELTLQTHAVEFVDKFPNKITDKTQLQRFLGSLNYISHFFEGCAQDRKLLNDRPKKDPMPWTKAHSQAVRKIKAKAKTLALLYISDDDLPKIVETDASNLGWGVVLKQVRNQGGKQRKEIVQFSFGLWKASEKNYSALDKEIKVALNAIHKFEIFLIHKKFLLRTDAAAMNKVLNKEIRAPSDAKFARWQALFSNFDFSIEHIKGTANCIPDFLSREHLQQTYMIISVQLRNGAEVLETIPNTLSWEQYSSNWKPHW